jgi:hypothetical protein
VIRKMLMKNLIETSKKIRRFEEKVDFDQQEYTGAQETCEIRVNLVLGIEFVL